MASRNENIFGAVSRRWLLVGSRVRLCGDQRLLLALDDGLLVGLELVGGSSGEVRVSNSGLRAHLWGGRSTTEHGLGLGSVVTHVLLGQLGGMGSVLAGDLAELVSLSINDVGRLLQLLVNELLVGGVDQGNSEEGGGGDQSKAPVWDNLDKPVGKEGADADLHRRLELLSHLGEIVLMGTYRDGSPDVLGEQDALRLDDREVDKLVDIANSGIKSLAGDGVVFAGAELARDTGVHDGLTGNLGGDGDAQNHPGKLEAPSEDIEIPNCEDEADDGSIGDGGSTWEPPVSIVSATCGSEEGYARGLFHDSSSEKKEW